jgi:uncharacterized repeat protein (TIGR01451 family)
MRPPRRRRRALAALAIGAGVLFAATATAQAHHINVKKVVQGGDSSNQAFTITVSKANSVGEVGQTNNLKHNQTSGGYSTRGGKTHRVKETALPAGYEFVGITCNSDALDQSHSAAGRYVDFKVRSYGDPFCTVTNRKLVNVVVNKDFAGPGLTGDERVAISLDGTTSAALADGGSTGKNGIGVTSSSQAVAIGEAGANGTDLADYTAALSCSGTRDDNTSYAFDTDRVSATSWKLKELHKARAGSTINCTITNTRDAGTLKIRKYLFAPAAPASFDFQSSLGDFSQTAQGGQYSSGKLFNDLMTGVEYTVYELPRPGYEFLPGSSHCSGGDAPRSATWSVDAQGRGVLRVTLDDKGDDVVCNFKNRQVPKLVIKKQLEIGPLDASVSFPFGGSVAEGRSVSFDAAGLKTVAEGFVPAGVAQSVSETLPDGYEFTGATCDQGITPSVSGTGIGVTIPSSKADKTVTCTFVNTPDRGKIIVTKNVVNDNGGEAGPGDFTMNITGTDPSRTGFPGDDRGTAVYVTPGAYSVDEDAAPGYGKTLGEGCEGTVAAGETKNCVITNDDIAPRLTVIKNVDNANGGGALTAADFSLQVQREGLDTISFPGSAGTEVIVNAGPYTVTEPDTKGYSAAFSADCSGTIALAENRTCTVTNTSPTPETPQTPQPPVVSATPAPEVQATRTAPAALRITKTGPARARVLKRFRYTIRVRNSSRVVARNVVMRDTLPRGIVHLRSIPKAAQAGRVLTVRLGDLKPGQVRTIRVNVRAAGGVRGARTNLAVASADNARRVRDSTRTVFVRPTARIIPAVTG